MAIVPVQFNMNFKEFSIISPAYIDTTLLYNVAVGNQSGTGLFSGFTTTYINADVYLKNNTQKIGLLFYTDREGDFFRKTRAYARYANSINLSRNKRLSLGVTVGFANYAFEASQAAPGGSATTLDSDLGAVFSTKKFNLGIGVNQVFENKLTPLDYTFVLQKTAVYFIEYKTPITSLLHLSLINIGFLKKSNYKNSLLMDVIYNDIISFGAGAVYQKGYFFHVGINNLQVSNLLFSASFSLFNYTSSGFIGNDIPIESFAKVNQLR